MSTAIPSPISTHHRMHSGSLKIDIPSSSSSASPTTRFTSTPPISDRLRQRTKRMRATYAVSDDNWFALVVTWLNGRSWARVKRWFWLLLVGGAVWVVITARTRRPRKDSFFLDDDDAGPPKVDRLAMEKLRLLELHWGTTEEDDTAHFLDADSSSDSPPRRPPSHRGDSPPLVVHIPDALKPNPLLPPPLPKLSASVIDSVVCPSRSAQGDACAFLLPAFLGEQETKAQQHLHQLGLLALALNRTLVLPNVKRSRLGTCFPNPFDFYYEPDSLEKLGVHTISYAEFLEWILRRQPAPTAQVVSMSTPKSIYPDGAIEIDAGIADSSLIPNKPSRNLCLKPPRTRLNFLDHSPLIIYPAEGYHKSEAKRTLFGTSVVNTLNSKAVAERASRKSTDFGVRAADEDPRPNVLVINYELRYPLLNPAQVLTFNADLIRPLPYSPFAYAPSWTEMSQSLADSLSPFISIHWRTETLPPDNLLPCATSLVQKILTLADAHPDVKTIYLATDYPIEDLELGVKFEESTPHSGTFSKAVTGQHHKAFRALLNELDKKPFVSRGLRWTTFIKEERAGRVVIPKEVMKALVEARVDSIAELDPGLVGIIDKGVTIRSEVFLTGLSGVGPTLKQGCAKVSSFTSMIIDSRVEVLKAQEQESLRGGPGGGQDRKGTLWNQVARWNVKGNYVD